MSDDGREQVESRPDRWGAVIGNGQEIRSGTDNSSIVNAERSKQQNFRSGDALKAIHSDDELIMQRSFQIVDGDDVLLDSHAGSAGLLIAAKFGSPDIELLPIRTDFKNDAQFEFAKSAWKSFRDESKKWMSTIPSDDMAEFKKKDYKFAFVADIAKYDAQVGTTYGAEQVQGYPNGWNGGTTGAFFDANHKTVVIMQTFSLPGVPRPMETMRFLDMPGRVRHEFAHALEHLRGRPLENDPELSKIYEKEKLNLASSPVTSKNLSYYLQPNDFDNHGKVIDRPGLRETIAELYAIRHGGGTDAKWRDKSLQDAFSGVLNYLNKKGF